MTDRRAPVPRGRELEPPRQVDAIRPCTMRFQAGAGFPVHVAAIRYAPPVDPLTGETLGRSWRWSLEVDGLLADCPGPGPSPECWDMWAFGTLIDEEEYEYLLRCIRCARGGLNLSAW